MKTKHYFRSITVKKIYQKVAWGFGVRAMDVSELTSVRLSCRKRNPNRAPKSNHAESGNRKATPQKVKDQLND